MIFHSLDFVVFFIVTTSAYWCLPRRAQNVLLIAASYVFYGYVHPWFLILIATTTVVDYLAARGMEAWPAHKDEMLGASLAVNLGVLGFFKYFGFFAENIRSALALVGLDASMPVLTVILPVGISFYTFQELSYTIEVYRGTLRARRDFLDFAAFVCFYPQLVAGPIERASRLLPQVEQRRVWSWAAAEEAACLIAWGYFKKLVIADNVGVLANKVFALASPSFPVLWAGVFAFAVQIYADFSAYSDIARGVARWLGFDLMKNFDHPYMAAGPGEFWHRWHISLSTWFRDYVYIPLGGSRGSRFETARNLMITFVLSGFWHGASWNYLLWGAYHGALVVGTRTVGERRKRRASAGAGAGARSDAAPPAADASNRGSSSDIAPRGVRIMRPVLPASGFSAVFRTAGTFVLVLVGWLMFRETDIHMLIHDALLSPSASTAADRQVAVYLCLLTMVYSAPMWIESVWVVHVRPRLRAAPAGERATLLLRGAFAGLAFALILVFRSQQSLDFIYFRF